MKPHSGVKRIETAGKAERLVDHSIYVDHVDIFAFENNAGVIYVGGPETHAAAKQGAPLATDGTRGDVYTPPGAVDLSDIWLDATTALDGASFCWWSVE